MIVNSLVIHAFRGEDAALLQAGNLLRENLGDLQTAGAILSEDKNLTGMRSGTCHAGILSLTRSGWVTQVRNLRDREVQVRATHVAEPLVP